MTDDNFDLAGIQLISDMSNEDLIDELVVDWRKELTKKGSMELKQMVISVRILRIKDRMIREAGLKQSPGFLGFPTITEDDSDE